ncbi:MAG: lysophospholipid acyltransferase family protein [Hyphomicrobiales bacterium]|nr:lysophospholipid acyltransferase family protein [Hyphomicrobiales bacterium]
MPRKKRFRPLRALAKSTVVRALACWLVQLYVRLVYYTTRWQWIGEEHWEMVQQSSRPVIFVFWHGRLLMLPMFVPQPQHTAVIISRHGDGALIARVIRYFHLQVIHGSSNRPGDDPKGAKNRGGAAAMRQAVQWLQSGKTIAITPDGPKGPACKVQGAVMELARLTGALVVPVAYHTGCGKTLGTWDRFWFPYPFGRGVVAVASPLALDAMTVEKAGKTLEDRLNQITKQAVSANI